MKVRCVKLGMWDCLFSFGKDYEVLEKRIDEGEIEYFLKDDDGKIRWWHNSLEIEFEEIVEEENIIEFKHNGEYVFEVEEKFSTHNDISITKEGIELNYQLIMNWEKVDQIREKVCDEIKSEINIYVDSDYYADNSEDIAKAIEESLAREKADKGNVIGDYSI